MTNSYKSQPLSALETLSRSVPADQPVLIAGATASGKSALALAIAQHSGGTIVNADALQVFENWRIVTARPSLEDEARAPHKLYGHIKGTQEYSVGHWLRDLREVLQTNSRPIIVGGTGLNLSALTQGLVDIPMTPPDVRQKGEALLKIEGLSALLAAIDPETLSRIDQNNPARVARAWEVQQTTGRGLASWQADTPPPLLALSQTRAFHLDADRDWLRERIARRFDLMIDEGALDEAHENLAIWNPKDPSAKAIGAPELIAYLQGNMSLDNARENAIIASQQYAKRQRTWFKKRMKDWETISLPE
jgi:tRNA dimethylallyltransferase